MGRQVSKSPFLTAIKTLWCWASSMQMNKTEWLQRKDATILVILKMSLLLALPWLVVLDPKMFNSPFYRNMLPSPQLSSGHRMEMLKTWRYFFFPLSNSVLGFYILNKWYINHIIFYRMLYMETEMQSIFQEQLHKLVAMSWLYLRFKRLSLLLQLTVLMAPVLYQPLNICKSRSI